MHKDYSYNDDYSCVFVIHKDYPCNDKARDHLKTEFEMKDLVKPK
jgi:hypothetical protein